MTKKEKAVELFRNMKDAGRDEVVEAFITHLGMTKAGATTYYYNVVKEVKQDSQTTATSKRKKQVVVAPPKVKGSASVVKNERTVSTDPDNNVLYTIVEEKDGTVIKTHSYWHMDLAQSKARGRMIVKGLPEIGSSITTLKPL